MGLSNYPPGVSGFEPEITGEWPCEDCDGLGYTEDEDGKRHCLRCKGKGIEPEDFDLDYLQVLLDEQAPEWRTESVIEWARCIHWNRSDPEQRKMLRIVCQLRGLTR